jgi:hypothetical protein
MSSTNGVPINLSTISISSKTLEQMARIITTIKDMENSEYVGDLTQLKRMLYRSMDSLTELELGLLRLKEEKHSRSTQ